MKKLTVFAILLLLLVSAASCNSGTGDSGNKISGTLESGLRILTVPRDGDLDYTVYRGDYIVFRFPDGAAYDFSVPDLDISISLPRPESEKPYVKMSSSGEFRFTLGTRKGIMRVVDLKEPYYKELTAREARDLMDNTDPLIIDVRTEGEYAAGRIQGAELIPVQLIAANLDKLEKYKDRDILLYCQSGNRSTVAARIMLDGGFTKIYNLRYGYGDWAGKGYPVVR